jgi:hypothetical protein
MAEMIRDQQRIIEQNNHALLQHSKDYSRLCEIIGSLNISKKEKTQNNETGNDTEEINYNEN